MKKRLNFQGLQQLGRALMLPIAVLPIAGILLRIGQPDLLNMPAIAGAGQAIFSQLPLLFAVGVAIGFAKGNNGAAALAALVGYLIMTTVLKTMNPDVDTGVLGGIIIGVLAGLLYNRFYEIKLPAYLAFFGGKRFVPIITGLVAVGVGFAFGYIWPPIQDGLTWCGNWLIGSGSLGLFLYGFFNRILLTLGLHHILNNLVWFQFGSFTTASGAVVHGDIARFMAGDPTAGSFMAGFFPIMMFGLPAACLAMYRNAHSHKQKAVAGLFLSLALTSFLTGVTEPIEYGFIFLAPLLFFIHAVLTGLSMAVMYWLGVKLGFTFSAGLVDYVLFFNMGTHPLLLIPVGIVTFVIYYCLFSFFIRRFDLKTMGREDDDDEDAEVDETFESSPRAEQFVIALGGKKNLVNVDACTTRLRLVVGNSAQINKGLLNKLGAKGVLTPDGSTVQVILGPEADLVAGQIRAAMVNMSDDFGMPKVMPTASVDMPANTATSLEVTEKDRVVAHSIIDALGGKNNIKNIRLEALTRVRLELVTADMVDQDALSQSGVVRLMSVNVREKQLFIPQDAAVICMAMQEIVQ